MFRVDPITEEGKVDLEFFASEDYKIESKILSDYLKKEGFEVKEGRFFIDFYGRTWEVTYLETK
jgi:hypothetical protein